MRWPKLPFDSEFLKQDFPRGCFKILNYEGDALKGISTFERDMAYIVMKYVGLSDILVEKENRISFYAENPLYSVYYDGIAYLKRRETYNNLKLSHLYQEFLIYDPIVAVIRENRVNIDPNYLYFEIFNLFNGIKGQSLSNKVLMLNIDGRELLIKPELDREPFSQENMHLNAIGAIRLLETTEEEIKRLEDIVRKIFARISWFFMNFVEIGSFMWIETKEGRTYRHLKIVPYFIRKNVPSFNVCYVVSRNGEIAFSGQCRNISSKVASVIEKFISGLGSIDDIDMAFLKENIAGARGETSVEYKIVKYAVALEKLHSLIGRKLGISCSPPDKNCVKEIYDKFPVLKEWYDVQKDLYQFRNSIVHGSVKEYEKRIQCAYEVTEKTQTLLGILLGILSGLIKNTATF